MLPSYGCFIVRCTGIHAPGRCSDRSKCWAGDSVTEPYLCIHSVNLAHAYTSHLYRSKYQQQQGGKIGITLSVGWSEPATDSAADRQASDIALQFDFGAWADPIWFGDYPAVMRENCGALLPRLHRRGEAAAEGQQRLSRRQLLHGQLRVGRQARQAGQRLVRGPQRQQQCRVAQRYRHRSAGPTVRGCTSCRGDCTVCSIGSASATARPCSW